MFCIGFHPKHMFKLMLDASQSSAKFVINSTNQAIDSEIIDIGSNAWRFLHYTSLYLYL